MIHGGFGTPPHCLWDLDACSSTHDHRVKALSRAGVRFESKVLHGEQGKNADLQKTWLITNIRRLCWSQVSSARASALQSSKDRDVEHRMLLAESVKPEGRDGRKGNVQRLAWA